MDLITNFWLKSDFFVNFTNYSIVFFEIEISELSMTEELMTNRLFEIKNAFDFSAENKQLFLESIKEMIEFHRHQSEMYDNICKQYNFSSQQLMTEEDIFNIPHIIVNAFKERKIIL